MSFFFFSSNACQDKELLNSKYRCSCVYFTRVKACSILIRLPLGGEILIQRVPWKCFCLCVYAMLLLSSLFLEKKNVSVGCLSLLLCHFCLPLLWHKAPGACLLHYYTYRQQTRHCTQTKTDVGMDVLFRCYACCLLFAVSLAFHTCIIQLFWLRRSESGRCEDCDKYDTCGAPP